MPYSGVTGQNKFRLTHILWVVCEAVCWTDNVINFGVKNILCGLTQIVSSSIKERAGESECRRLAEQQLYCDQKVSGSGVIQVLFLFSFNHLETRVCQKRGIIYQSVPHFECKKYLAGPRKAISSLTWLNMKCFYVLIKLVFFKLPKIDVCFSSKWMNLEVLVYCCIVAR